MPGAKIFSKVDQRLGVPLNALFLVTLVQMLLGLIYLGSSSAFLAFVSVGVQALALSYGIPIAISFFSGRKEVNQAQWHIPYGLGTVSPTGTMLFLEAYITLGYQRYCACLDRFRARSVQHARYFDRPHCIDHELRQRCLGWLWSDRSVLVWRSFQEE